MYEKAQHCQRKMSLLLTLSIQIKTYQARLSLTFLKQVPSFFNAVVKTTKIFRALQAIRADPSYGAVTLLSQVSIM